MAGKSLIQRDSDNSQNTNTVLASAAKTSMTATFHQLMNSKAYQDRIEKVLGENKEDFVNALVTIVSNDAMLQNVVRDAPGTILSAALNAATHGLDMTNGEAYVMAFKESKKDASGKWVSKYKATMVTGYLGLIQLGLRTGMYKYLNASPIYEGQKFVVNYLTSIVDIEGEPTSDKAIAYFAYFQLLNGMEHCVCWSKDRVMRHEEQNRKGEQMSKAWRDHFDAMGTKTVLRELMHKWAPKSKKWLGKTFSDEQLAAQKEIADVLENDSDDFIDGEGVVYEDSAPIIDSETGEIKTEQ